MGEAFLIGIADTALGKLAPLATFDLTAQAALAALEDAGLELSAVDGLITTVPMVGAFPRHSAAVAEYLGISARVKKCQSVNLGGASPLGGLIAAFQLVQSGACDVVLVVAADTPRTGQDRRASVGAFSGMRHPAFEQPFGMLNVSAYGLVADAYLTRYSLDRDSLASIPVELRRHASTNPAASYRDPLTVEDVLASRVVSTPFHLLECSPITDGGAAFVVAKGGLAAAATTKVELRASAEGYVYDNVAFAGDLSRTGCSVSAERAFRAAGMVVSDIDVAELYDSYSITLAVELEEIGLCGPGEAGRFVAEGGISMAGPIPVNTHGGLLSHGHCAGAAGVHHITEAVRQLRGAAANQVSGAEVALLHAEGGIISANCTAILTAG